MFNKYDDYMTQIQSDEYAAYVSEYEAYESLALWADEEDEYRE